MMRQIAHIYLCIVPLITFILAFTVGHASPTIYVPVWIAHSTLMMYLIWQLGAKYFIQTNERGRSLIVASLLVILPWILATIFAGMGPPPFTLAGWAELADEQRIRFGILVICGLSIAAAFSLLNELITSNGRIMYARLAFTAILIAMPVFLIVTAFWGTVFTDAAILITETNPQTKPEWLAPLRHMIDFLSTIEVCLFYTATALLSIALRKESWLSVKASRAYLFVSLFAIAATLLPASVPEPLVVLNYVTGIPAITMLMPYLTGLALLKRVELL